MGYDKNRFINNIYILAKKQKIKIGELEAACGVSNGYLSRLRLDERNTAPGADLLMKVADRLSVSVDSLLSFNYGLASEAEQKLLNYLEKLRWDTESNRLRWQRDPVTGPVSSPFTPRLPLSHPLFTVSKEDLLSEEERMEDELPPSVSLSQICFRSFFHPDLENLQPGEIFRCSFPGNRILYLSAVICPGSSVPGPAAWTELELVMAGGDLSVPVPLAHTDHENPGVLDKAVAHLFEAVKTAVSFSPLTPQAAGIIDDYLRG